MSDFGRLMQTTTEIRNLTSEIYTSGIRNPHVHNVSPAGGLYSLWLWWEPCNGFPISMYPRLLHLTWIFSITAMAAVPGYYIVEMPGDPVAVHVAKHARAAGIRSPAAEQRRVRIREEQRPVKGRLEALHAEILGSVDTVANAFIVH